MTIRFLIRFISLLLLTGILIACRPNSELYEEFKDTRINFDLTDMIPLSEKTISPNQTSYIQREFGIRNALKKLNRQLEKVADSFGNYTDI